MGYGGITVARGRNGRLAMRLEPGTELHLERHFPFGHENKGRKTPTKYESRWSGCEKKRKESM